MAGQHGAERRTNDWGDAWPVEADDATDASTDGPGEVHVEWLSEADAKTDPLDAFPSERAELPAPAVQRPRPAARVPATPRAPAKPPAAATSAAPASAPIVRTATIAPRSWSRTPMMVSVCLGGGVLALAAWLVLSRDVQSPEPSASSPQVADAAAPSRQGNTSPGNTGAVAAENTAPLPPLPAPTSAPSASPPAADGRARPAEADAPRAEAGIVRPSPDVRATAAADRAQRPAVPPAAVRPSQAQQAPGAQVPPRTTVAPVQTSPPTAALPATPPPVLDVSRTSTPAATAAGAASLGSPPLGRSDGAVTASTPSSSPIPSPVPTDRQQIDTLIERYRAAFSALDARAVRAVWPGVDASALERAFAQLERQQLVFGACTVSVAGARATAACSGNSMYVTRVGGRGARLDDRHWTFDLQKTTAGWSIAGVTTR
jgi:hypothetical protein